MDEVASVEGRDGTEVSKPRGMLEISRSWARWKVDGDRVEGVGNDAGCAVDCGDDGDGDCDVGKVGLEAQNHEVHDDNVEPVSRAPGPERNDGLVVVAEDDVKELVPVVEFSD